MSEAHTVSGGTDVLIYSDLHLRMERLADCKLVLEEIDLATHRGHGIKTLVNLGDTFSTRGIIPTQCLTLYHHYVQKWAAAGIFQIILVGNHDQEDAAGEVHPLKVFDGMNRMIVVDKPLYIDRHGALTRAFFFPYGKVTEAQLAYPKKVGVESLFVHWGIQGASRNDTNIDTDGVPKEWLSGFGRVFSGHYHKHHWFDNIVYVGSPMEQDFGESGQEKGYVLLDGNTHTWSHARSIAMTRLHHIVKVKVDDSGEMSFDTKGLSIVPTHQLNQFLNDMVRFDLSGSTAALSMIDAETILKKTGFVSHGIKFAGVTINRESTDGDSKSRMGVTGAEIHSTPILMEKYIKHIDPSLDHAELLRIGQDFLS